MNADRYRLDTVRVWLVKFVESRARFIRRHKHAKCFMRTIFSVICLPIHVNFTPGKTTRYGQDFTPYLHFQGDLSC